MDDTQFIVQVDDGINELSEDYSCLVLLQKTVFFGVLEEISLG